MLKVKNFIKSAPSRLHPIQGIRVCDEAPYVRKAQTKFRSSFNNYKSKHKALSKGDRRIPQKRFRDGFTLFEQCETPKQLKERKLFGSTK